MLDFRIEPSITKVLSLLTLLFTVTLNLSAADGFYTGYSESERLVIAGAYLAVGDHYSELGESKKAEEYKSMAEEIFPGIKTQNITPQSAPQKPVLTASPARPSGKEPAAVQYYFGKMMRAVFSENIKDIDSLLSTRLYLPGYDEGVEKKDVLNYVQSAFDKYPLDKIDPAVYYKLDRFFIRPEGSAWVAEVNLTNKGIQVFNDYLRFPGTKQKFYFREYREGWRLIAISGE